MCFHVSTIQFGKILQKLGDYNFLLPTFYTEKIQFIKKTNFPPVMYFNHFGPTKATDRPSTLKWKYLGSVGECSPQPAPTTASFPRCYFRISCPFSL